MHTDLVTLYPMKQRRRSGGEQSRMRRSQPNQNQNRDRTYQALPGATGRAGEGRQPSPSAPDRDERARASTSYHASRRPPAGDLFGVDAVLADLERGEAPIRLQDVPKHPLVPRRGNRPVHLSVPYRWVMRGLKGHRLEAARCGGTVCTSNSAIMRFFRRLSGVDAAPNARTPHRRERELARAEVELEAVGL